MPLSDTEPTPEDELEYVRWEQQRLAERERELLKQIEAKDAEEPV